jgi:hypothetical protein
MLFAIEGPDHEILVIRTRLDATVPASAVAHAEAVVNEWNHTRRFLKAYLGDPVDDGSRPVYAELQLALAAGASDDQLHEFIDLGAAVAAGLTEWLHGEGGLF